MSSKDNCFYINVMTIIFTSCIKITCAKTSIKVHKSCDSTLPPLTNALAKHHENAICVTPAALRSCGYESSPLAARSQVLNYLISPLNQHSCAYACMCACLCSHAYLSAILHYHDLDNTSTVIK